ncbi:MAG: 5-(carboxyamino)imidazole ribonucleotide synthase [Planctomycetota bacterium]
MTRVHRLGVLGGGQLARMLALAAAPLGIRVRALDPDPDACAGDACELACGGFDDEDALLRFASGLDAATYEFENVPASAVEFLADRLSIRPGAASLHASQDRAREKAVLADAGFDVAPWACVDDQASLHDAVRDIGAPAILKTRTGGYDGKGQARIAHAGDASDAWASIGRRPAIAEARINFERELSLVAVRSESQFAAYPLVENAHRGGILRVTRAPACDADHLQRGAKAQARALMDALGHVGVLAIEFFEVGGRLVANEFAPRVHNSGHWTIDAAATSQFENHVRAVAGLPLGPTTPLGPAVMLNCIGRMPDAAAVLTHPDAALHDYRKRPRPGRKVGHVTVRGEHDPAELVRAFGIDLTGNDERVGG